MQEREGPFDPTLEPPIKEKGWFSKQNIQNFIHDYIAEKMRTEKMTVVVGHSYERLLAGLERGALKLNEMRPLREPNYSNLRTVIRDPK